MKVLQINSVCGIGSTGKVTLDLYQVLKEQGHECCICYGRGSAPEGINTIRIGSNREVYEHVIYTRLTDRTAFASKKATEKLIHRIKQYNPDIIHLHNLHGYYINIQLLFDYFKEFNKPVLWSLYDCWSFTGHCSHFDYIGCNKWKVGCCHCPQKKLYPASLLWDNSFDNYRRKKEIIQSYKKLIIVPPTTWLANLLKESYLRDFPVFTIPSGIDLDAFKPVESDLRKIHGLEDKYVVLGVASGFHKFKGSQYLIDLANELPDQYKLVLIGVDNENRHLYPENMLVLPKIIDSKELAQYYTMADVFVNPTLQETQGLTNIEAMACGTGVVAFHSGGCPESIDETCGYVVERDDFKGLLSSVIKACERPFDPNSCIQRAKFYDKSRLYGEYIKLYEHCLNTCFDKEANNISSFS